MAAMILGVLVLRAYWKVRGRTVMEFRITQNTDLILFSDFGEPAQFAIWLENPYTGLLRTIFVTYRSATGDWEGKAECPAALPRWFEIYQKEMGVKGLPGPGAKAPDAVTGATPRGEDFARSVEIEPGSRWICWIEVNISADYNAFFQRLDEAQGVADTDQSGQPSIIYRGEITANIGSRLTPELYGSTVPGSQGMIDRNLEEITTAKDIFRSIEISVIPPALKLF
jgi:hypothetical protein